MLKQKKMCTTNPTGTGFEKSNENSEFKSNSHTTNYFDGNCNLLAYAETGQATEVEEDLSSSSLSKWELTVQNCPGLLGVFWTSLDVDSTGNTGYEGRYWLVGWQGVHPRTQTQSKIFWFIEIQIGREDVHRI